MLASLKVGSRYRDRSIGSTKFAQKFKNTNNAFIYLFVFLSTVSISTWPGYFCSLENISLVHKFRIVKPKSRADSKITAGF